MITQIDPTAMANRIWRLAHVLSVLFLILAGFLAYWQVFDASSLTAQPENPRLYAVALAVQRGTIYDSMGQRLAWTAILPSGAARRVSPLSLAAVLGYHSLRYGDSGLEAALAPYLTVSSPSLQPLDTTWRRLLHQPITGDSVQLTIDARIQRIAANALGSGPGVAIVSDPRTGAILAMVSQPTFDPTRIDDPGYWQTLIASHAGILLNRAIQGLYPPGSTFKTITLAGALQSGIASLSTPFVGQQATGPLVVQGFLLPASIDNLPYGVSSVTLQQAYQYSDNIVYAEVGMQLGAARLLATAHQFGFDRSLPFDLPVTPSTVTTNPATFSQLDTATSAFGQDRVLVTPLQMALVTNAIANGGAIMTPYLVQNITTATGAVMMRHTSSLFAGAVTPQTASAVGQAMRAVVDSGSGFAARIAGVSVAGKTGTAQVQNGNPHAWFIGYAPADHPRLSVVVLKENAGEGAFVAAPIARQILVQSLPLVR